MNFINLLASLATLLWVGFFFMPDTPTSEVVPMAGSAVEIGQITDEQLIASAEISDEQIKKMLEDDFKNTEAKKSAIQKQLSKKPAPAVTTKAPVSSSPPKKVVKVTVQKKASTPSPSKHKDALVATHIDARRLGVKTQENLAMTNELLGRN